MRHMPGGDMLCGLLTVTGLVIEEDVRFESTQKLGFFHAAKKQ